MDSKPPTPSSVLGGRILVTLATAVWLLGSAMGVGLLYHADGAPTPAVAPLSDHATLVAPHAPAFLVWFVIYVAMLGYVVWQWLPSASLSQWAAATRVPAALALALTGIWLQVAEANLLGLSVLVMFAILVALCWIVVVARGLRRDNKPATMWVQVTCGLHLGWVTVLCVSNTAAWLVSLGAQPTDDRATALSIVMILVVVVLSAVLLRSTILVGFQIGYTATAAWGLCWIAVGRLAGQLVSYPVGWCAAIASVIVVCLGAVRVSQHFRSAL